MYVIGVLALLFCFVPDLTKLTVLMMKRLIYTHARRGSAVFSCWTAEWSSVVTSAAVCIFLHTEAEGYSTTGRSEVRGHLLLLVPAAAPSVLDVLNLAFYEEAVHFH